MAAEAMAAMDEGGEDLKEKGRSLSLSFSFSRDPRTMTVAGRWLEASDEGAVSLWQWWRDQVVGGKSACMRAFQAEPEKDEIVEEWWFCTKHLKGWVNSNEGELETLVALIN